MSLTILTSDKLTRTMHIVLARSSMTLLLLLNYIYRKRQDRNSQSFTESIFIFSYFYFLFLFCFINFTLFYVGLHIYITIRLITRLHKILYKYSKCSILSTINKINIISHDYVFLFI